ncbi:VOC family protein [Caulobacter sp. DWR2-3-1b2]|uniref:VOC family protein n=1 Tax=unclassified Caulobacter TaxID=2648921 RepID=UPI003CF097E6
MAFWTEKLGLRVATDQLVGPGKHWIKLRIPGAEAGLALFTPDGQEDRVGKFFNGSFTCDDVEHAYRKMSEKGGRLRGAAREAASGDVRQVSRSGPATPSCCPAAEALTRAFFERSGSGSREEKCLKTED